jgi:hypothetical protein
MRLRLFDAATERQRLRQEGRPKPRKAADRGWRRADLYDLVYRFNPFR